jgi:hypothetical protein
MTWRGKIVAHYKKQWGPDGGLYALDKGRIHELPTDFLVLKYPPHGKRRVWTYATVCMSQADDLHPLELHMFSPRESEDVAELLAMTTHYDRTGAKLGLGHSVNFGRPWLDRSVCQNGLISLPYLDGPSLENLKTEHSTVKFYWLVPINAAEVHYKQLLGLEALERRFEFSRLDYADPARRSAV